MIDKALALSALDLPLEASYPEVKQRYRRLAMKHHPDRCKEEDSEEVFKSVKAAYEDLSKLHEWGCWESAAMQECAPARDEEGVAGQEGFPVQPGPQEPSVKIIEADTFEHLCTLYAAHLFEELFQGFVREFSHEELAHFLVSSVETFLNGNHVFESGLVMFRYELLMQFWSSMEAELFPIFDQASAMLWEKGWGNQVCAIFEPRVAHLETVRGQSFCVLQLLGDMMQKTPPRVFQPFLREACKQWPGLRSKETRFWEMVWRTKAWLNQAHWSTSFHKQLSRKHPKIAAWW